ncbi:MAG: hypothetical protein IT349_14780 [Candidatus Eisenbacteria bacterium]|nr:hypothetical protein [Candidatus Eisenbacteria bacterium]
MIRGLLLAALCAATPCLARDLGLAGVYFGPAGQAEGQRITLELDQMTLAEALNFLLEDSGLALAGTDSLRLPVDGVLDSVTVGEAVDHLLKQHGRTYRVEGNALKIDTQETRTFLVNQIAPDDNTFWPALEKNLPAVLSPGGRFVLNARAGLLTVVDQPEALTRIDDFLRQVEADLGRQIHVEAQIFETTLNDDDETGVNWRALEYGWDGYDGGTSNGGIAEQNTIGDTGPFQLGLIRTGRLRMLLSMLEQRGKLRVLSRPSVTTMGNSPAVFKATEQVPYYVIETFASSGNTPYIQYSIDFRDAGVELKVLGRSGADGIITLQVHPVVSTVTGFTASLPNLPPQPIIDLREMETTVRMREGETLVIGGLMQEREQRTTRGVPFLSRIPGVGAIFRSTRTSVLKQELTLVLTPRLLLDDERGRFQASGRSMALTPVWPEGTRYALAAYEHDRALAAYFAGEAEEAVERSRRVLAIAPDLAPERLNLGLYLAEAGWLREARTQWQSLTQNSALRDAAIANLAALDLFAAGGDDAPRPIASAEPAVLAVLALNESARLLRDGDRAGAEARLRQTMERLPASEPRRVLERRLADLPPPPVAVLPPQPPVP